jgi:hypothetical protein
MTTPMNYSGDKSHCLAYSAQILSEGNGRVRDGRTVANLRALPTRALVMLSLFAAAAAVVALAPWLTQGTSQAPRL